MPVPSSFNDLDTVANNNSPQGSETAKGNVDNYFRQAFSFIKQNYNSLATKVGVTGDETIAGVKTFSDTPVVPYIGGPRVMGLTGNVNATTPLTKFDLSANAVILRDANGATVTRYTTGTLTCDLGLAGSAANGRDQAGAFTANSWIYLYFIWNGAALATIASTSATAPTLPAGYTHYALATVIRWNASSNIVPMYCKGSRVIYDTAFAASLALTSGTATSMTAVSLTGFVPPNAARVSVLAILSVVHGTANVNFRAYIRPTGSAISGHLACDLYTQVSGVTASAKAHIELPLLNQSIDYRMGSTPSTSGGVLIDVLGYVVPNGDA